MTNKNILEEEIKNAVAADYFSKFDCTKILGKIDFAVKIKCPKNANDFNDEYLLWAEAKQKSTDIVAMLAQLVLTVGKARTFDEILPPPFLGCYDSEKIAFVPYSEIQDIFYQNDFNWNVAPSNYDTKEFQQIYNQIKKVIETDIPWETYLFYFERDDKDLRRFIRENFIVGKFGTSKIRIDKNNFIIIYNKWLETVKPTIQVNSWEKAKKAGIIDGDFYLADLLSAENKTLKEKLFVLLKTDRYELDRKIDESGFENFKTTAFSDNQKAHAQFWAKYERPPKEDYWDYIVNRRDLLVPQDVRERKGSYFTPQQWVELSQKYLADVFGENWQDEYYVWDCAAGTGNLLAGLTNKYNLWASTLDNADVDAMHTRIDTMNKNSISGDGANLLHDHVFQFDFLNDDFEKLPPNLKKIIDSPKLRKKLIIYINPPYAEADNRKGEKRSGVAVSKIHEKYSILMGYTKREIYIQFLTRIYCEIPGAALANFSKLKNLQAPKFKDFRKFFHAKLEKLILVPAYTFDNVTGDFPIGFFIWNIASKEEFKHISADVYDDYGNFICHKNIWSYDNEKLINDWVQSFRYSKSESIATIIGVGSDFQNQRLVRFGEPHMKVPADNHNWQITKNNLIESSIYFAVRKVIPADWLNDRDQFLYPNDGWKTDTDFQNDCLAYTLFSNNIQSKYGANHWIPFTEYQVGAQNNFASCFMTDFIDGKTNFCVAEPDLFYYAAGGSGGGYSKYEPKERIFSAEAKSVFSAGRALWRYYHAQPNVNVNASLYDIREYFQGRNSKGKMNNKSENERYTELIGALRDSLKILASKIEPKVYEYGFLKP
ncbi:MAG: hypothetical protein LBP63_04635 [Prevotellaceae bacterium]|jgi:hypothetical protein|nr:hypothetical protein [Prevotellaceae bacterium]